MTHDLTAAREHARLDAHRRTTPSRDRPASSGPRPLLCAAVLLAGTAGCEDPYGTYVVAEAPIAPISGSGIRGTFEISHGKGFEDDLSAELYKFVLPDELARPLAVYDAPRCDVDPAAAKVFDPPPVLTPAKPDGALGQIQRLGAEIGWVSPPSPFDPGGLTDNTLIGELSPRPGTPGYLIGKIAVVREPDRAGGAPGPWVACGVIQASDRVHD
jgi:hypothetical protein